MTIRVAWTASTDPNILNYQIQWSADQAIWAALATVTHTIPGPNWDATRSLFYYDDVAGGTTTWYRVAATDSLGQQSTWSPPFQATPAYVPPWETVQQIVSSAALEIGLGSAGADVMNSSDANIQQLCALLKSSGRDLVHLRQWNHLRKEYSFTTIQGVAEYPLPADFHNMIDQTWWNRTTRLPVGGPMSGQEWQYLKARVVGIVFNVLFRPWQRLILLYPPTNTPGGHVIAYEYTSGWWISQTGAPDTTVTDYPMASTDYVWFDPTLIMRKLKLEFLKAKGFDTTAAAQDYLLTLELVQAQDAPAPIINLNRTNMGFRDPPMGNQSVPVTGFGV